MNKTEYIEIDNTLCKLRELILNAEFNEDYGVNKFELSKISQSLQNITYAFLDLYPSESIKERG